MGIVEESLAFATNFLTQILVIIAGIATGTKYVLSEMRKGNERLGKKILGPDQDGKIGRGGLLDELRTELRTEFKRDLESIRTELITKINDSHKELTTMINDSHTALLNEFRRTSTRISYMSRDLGRVEKSLEKMSKGSYTAAMQETMREEENRDYHDIYDLDSDGDLLNNSNSEDDYNKKYRKGRKGGGV